MLVTRQIRRSLEQQVEESDQMRTARPNNFCNVEQSGVALYLRRNFLEATVRLTGKPYVDDVPGEKVRASSRVAQAW